jgi:hypothetical protein
MRSSIKGRARRSRSLSWYFQRFERPLWWMYEAPLLEHFHKHKKMMPTHLRFVYLRIHPAFYYMAKCPTVPTFDKWFLFCAQAMIMNSASLLMKMEQSSNFAIIEKFELQKKWIIISIAELFEKNVTFVYND